CARRIWGGGLDVW
nr:immunoglobulin heavy chain junction region [Macaca mulatta]MOV49667.1 immunoglobulin heavy chain junction region [Macaca mulatta]MOV49739.1 immunoglobulin heavy chain junction region [Macaca mulatta]MOV49938.1 immunoglobulin heavy chain junction region [Macaca mulatta]MOV49952.1 immunoglobulin heavy chain junction region [Macaca mulatta]